MLAVLLILLLRHPVHLCMGIRHIVVFWPLNTLKNNSPPSSTHSWAGSTCKTICKPVQITKSFNDLEEGEIALNHMKYYIDRTMATYPTEHNHGT